MIETISISKLKQTSTEAMKKRRSVVIESDGEFIGVFIIGPELAMKDQVIGTAGVIEAGRERESWNQD